MFLRLFFVLLLALNLAVGGWVLFGQNGTPRQGATDPGVPELHLWSEQPPSPAAGVPVAPPAMASTVPAASSSPAPAQSAAAAAVPKPLVAGHLCMTLGPFATPLDLRDARAALARDTLRSRSREEQATQFRGWWVHLPTSPSRAAALAEARSLQAHHIVHYFVVGSGDRQNTVSLGLFDDPANAHKRLDQVVAAGFPARLTERTGQVPQYWLDIVADRAHLDWRRLIRQPDVVAHGTACF